MVEMQNEKDQVKDGDKWSSRCPNKGMKSGMVGRTRLSGGMWMALNVISSWMQQDGWNRIHVRIPRSEELIDEVKLHWTWELNALQLKKTHANRQNTGKLRKHIHQFCSTDAALKKTAEWEKWENKQIQMLQIQKKTSKYKTTVENGLRPLLNGGRFSTDKGIQAIRKVC